MQVRVVQMKIIICILVCSIVFVIVVISIFRSSVRLELGNYLGALQDANEALILAPEYSEVTQILIFFSTQLASINILLYLLKTTSNSFILILKTLPILAWSLEISEFELRPLHI